jgi:protein-disulfide isomerase
LIRPTARFASVIALAAISLPLSNAVAQQQVPAAPAPEVSAPAPSAAITLPKPNPADFTAVSPTKEMVSAFLQMAWGYDDSRVWQVQGILKTPAEGTSKVFIVVADKSGKVKPSMLHFYVLPDGKHILAGDELLPFGDHPYTEFRALLQQRADGPYRGSAAKDLELVEFADFQCPHCKEAQANMDKLVADFPKARIVFQNYPLGNAAWKGSKPAASYGVCVAKLGGSDAFFQYASTVFDGQDGLSSDDGVTLTLNAAVAKVGLDPAKVAACAATPETKAAVEASVKLGKDVGVVETPTLLVNGRQVPLGGLPYETIKQIVQYQMKLDGLTQ